MSTAPLKTLIIEEDPQSYITILNELAASGLTLDALQIDSEPRLMAELNASWNAVVCSKQLRTMDGIRMLQLVHAFDPAIPFIFVSEQIDEEAIKAIQAGAQQVVRRNGTTLASAILSEIEATGQKRERQAADKLLRKLSFAVNQAADCIFITDASGRIEYVNPAFEKMTGYTSSEVIGRLPSLLKSVHHPPEFFARLWQTLLAGQVFKETMVNRTKAGVDFYEEKVITPLYDHQGTLSHFISTGRNITLRVQFEQARNRLNRVLDSSPDIVFMLRMDGSHLYSNAACRKVLGLSDQHLIAENSIVELFPPKFSQQLSLQIIPGLMARGEWKGEALLDSFDDTQPNLTVSLICLVHNDPTDPAPYLSFVGRDISEQKQLEKALQHKATHDELTSLPNRHFLMEWLQEALARSKRNKKGLALLFMDIDKFKRINDSLGHTAGDELLRQTAIRLRSCLRASDVISRLGGDEFTIVIEDLEHPEDVISVVSKIYRVFTLPLTINAQEIFVSLSVGVAVYPQDGKTEMELLRCSDIAMYMAKAKGPGMHQFYAPDMDSKGREFLQLESDIRYAFANGEFRLDYQPQISLQGNRISGVEALLRWTSPTRGIVIPSDFIPLLELTGLIIKVGDWVIREACRFYKRMAAAGHGHLHVSVNVSAIQFQNERFLASVKDILQDKPVPDGILEFEITENILIQNPLHTMEILAELSRLGVRAAIDDFGTGYSSLAYLKQLPIHTLKIDKTFVMDVDTDANDAAIVEASISMAHKLGLNVVAEGVETPHQLEFLQNLGCDQAQGFLFSKALTEQHLLAFMTQACCQPY